MSKIRITKSFSFEAAHALHGYDGLCKNIHGHSYKLDVTVIGEPISDISNNNLGMVIDFKDIKKIVNTEIVDVLDHATILNRNSPHLELAKTLKSIGHKVILVDYQPTTEEMIIDFANKISLKLPAGINLHHLLLRETATCFAEWHVSDLSLIHISEPTRR